jgi:hypothetical protein
MYTCICSRTNYRSTVLTVQTDFVLGRKLFSHGGWILSRVRPYGKIFQNLRDLLERGTARIIEPFSSSACLADLQYVDGLRELAGAPGAAAELTEDMPVLKLGVRALAG